MTGQESLRAAPESNRLVRLVMWLDRLDERYGQPWFERAFKRFDRIFGGGSGPYE